MTPQHKDGKEGDAPDYDITIHTDDVLADLVEMAQDAAERRDEYRQWHRRELERGYDINPQYEYWVREQTGLLTALGRAIAALQPEQHHVLVDGCRQADGTVAVRDYMRWLSDAADGAHQVVNEKRDAPRASKMETGYSRVLSVLRDDYGIGWPRLDDVGGNPLECDLP
jgi:hypothetical protein